MLQLTNDQEHACDTAMDWLTDRTSKYLVISGPAGCGKSTLVETFLERVKVKANLLASILGSRDKKHEWEVDMMATTNKAAGVLSEMSENPVSTVHSYLNLVPRKDYDTGKLTFIPGRKYKIIHNKLLIIDESSFISDSLYEFLDKGTKHCKIILVGDPYQLVPAEQKKLVMDTIGCERANLTEVVRHNSDIANLGAQCREMVRSGRFTGIRPNDKDIVWLPAQEMLDTVNEMFTDPSYTMDTGRILTWTNKQVTKYNTHIRLKKGMSATVDPGEMLVTNKPILASGKTAYGTDTRVLVTDVVGETVRAGVPGRLVRLSLTTGDHFLPDNQDDVSLLLRRLKKRGDMQDFFNVKETWLDLRPVFVSTVHKSQGSTFDTVFVDLSNIGRCPIPDEVARMLYVGATRPAKKVVFFGQLPARYGGILNGIHQAAA